MNETAVSYGWIKQLSQGGIRLSCHREGSERDPSLSVFFEKKSVILVTTSDVTKIVVTEHLSLGWDKLTEQHTYRRGCGYDKYSASTIPFTRYPHFKVYPCSCKGLIETSSKKQKMIKEKNNRQQHFSSCEQGIDLRLKKIKTCGWRVEGG